MSKIIDRLHRAQGQLAGVERMLEQKKACSEVVTQILAARASLAGVACELLKEQCAKTPKKDWDKLAKELFKVV